MITYVNGDLLDSKDPLIVHGCNAQGVMGSGVALAIKNKFPHNFKMYRMTYEEEGLVLGDVIYSNTKQDDPAGNQQWIANLISQKFYGKDGKKYVSYDAIDDGMKDIAYFCKAAGITCVSMPLIGCGFGGGNWYVVEAIIRHRLPDLKVTIYQL